MTAATSRCVADGGLRQAWGMLEAQEGNLELARQMLKCSVKADPSSQQSWQVGVCWNWANRVSAI